MNESVYIVNTGKSFKKLGKRGMREYLEGNER